MVGIHHGIHDHGTRGTLPALCWTIDTASTYSIVLPQITCNIRSSLFIVDFICPSQYAKSHSFVTLSSTTTTLVCIRALQFSSVEFNSLPLLSFIKCCVVRSHTGKFYTVLLFAAHHLLLCFSAALRVFLEIKSFHFDFFFHFNLRLLSFKNLLVQSYGRLL